MREKLGLRVRVRVGVGGGNQRYPSGFLWFLYLFRVTPLGSCKPHQVWRKTNTLGAKYFVAPRAFLFGVRSGYDPFTPPQPDTAVYGASRVGPAC